MKTKNRKEEKNRPFLVYSLSLFFILAIASVATAATVSVQPQTQDLAPGATFSFTVNVDSGSDPVSGANIVLNYNTNVIVVNSITKGSLLGSGSGILESPGNDLTTPGIIKYGVARVLNSNPAVPVNGVYLTVNAQIKNSALAGISPVDITTATLKKNPSTNIASVTVNDGQVNVTGNGVPPSGATVSVIPATQSAAPDGVFSIDVKVNSGTKNLSEAKVELNYDTSVLEATSITNGSLLGSPVDEFEKDFTTAGKIKYGVRRASGNTASPVNGVFLTVNFKVKTLAPSGDSNLDLQNVSLMNDSTNTIDDAVVSDGKVTISGGTTTGPSVSVIPAIQNAPPNGMFSVDVKVNSGTNNLHAAKVELNYDTNVLEVNSITNKASLLGTPILEAPAPDTDLSTPGRIRYAASRVSPNADAPANGVFLTVNFKVKSSAPIAESVLGLANVNLKKDAAASISGVQLNNGKVNVTGTPVPGELKWKFISVPYLLNNSSADYVLRGLVKGTDYTELYAWDSAGKKWVSPVTDFMPLNGYLIRMDTSKPMADLEKETGPYALPSLKMNMGWNLVGTSGTSAMSAEIMLDSIVESYYSIVNWNVAIQDYDTVGVNSVHIPPGQVGTDAFMMQPGIGYWVSAKNNAELFPIDT